MREAIKAIRAAITLPIQLGGGIRDMKARGGLAGGGHHSGDPGNRGADQSRFGEGSGAHFPGRIVVGADAKGGKIATQGWAETSELTPAELGKRFEDAGVAAILFTDVDRDGLLQGVNVEATAALARFVRIPVIASGGVSGIGDIEALDWPPTSRISAAWWSAGRFMTGG